MTNAIALPKIVSVEEWQAAHENLLAREKAATRARDALAVERRRQPMMEIGKDYRFVGPGGETNLAGLFEGRRQLVLYHFMFGPGVHNWPDAGCDGCSMFVDQVGHLSHFHARDTSFCLVSKAPFKDIQRFRGRMEWKIPWYSSQNSDFNVDFGVTTPRGEGFALTVLLRDGERVFQTYRTGGRGVEALGSVWSFLDLTPFGRQETWEESPEGWPRTEPYGWWRLHDEYGKPQHRHDDGPTG